MKIYISGKITGNKNFLCDFINAETYLKDKYKDAQIINPVDTSNCRTWAEYMRTDLKKLLCCDTIYMIKNWRRSRGARLEYKIAKSLDFKILFEG